MSAGDPVVMADHEVVIPPVLGLALVAVKDALEQAPQECRYHGDVPPSKPGGWTSSCDSCEQPARVRKALALLRRAAGEPPPPRRYVVDTTAPPGPVSGLYPVLGTGGQPIRGLRAPGDADQARKALAAELERRGEVGPFDLLVTIKGESA